MSLTNDDFKKLGSLLDKRDKTVLKRVQGLVGAGNEMVIAKTETLVNKRDQKLLDKMSDLMDERMLYFHEKVTEPMVDNVVEMLRGEISEMSNKLEVVENNTYRIEKKLDNISDHHSEKIDNHEKRIVRLEKVAMISL